MPGTHFFFVGLGLLLILVGSADAWRSRRKRQQDLASGQKTSDARASAVPLALWFVAGAWFVAAGIGYYFVSGP